jgi:hypothetical protein
MMARSYESLMGAIGRSVYYRPERQRVRELLSRDANPKLLVNGIDFPLFDVSMNGVSFLSNGSQNSWKVGQELDLTLVLHDEVVYRGKARIARSEFGPGKNRRVGLGLTTGFLDLPEMARRDDEKRLDRDLEEGPDGRFSLVPGQYKAEVTRVARFLAFYRRSLSRHERLYCSGSDDDPGSTELARRSLEAIRDRWWEMQVRVSRAALECLQSPAVLRAAKEYTETVVTPLVMESPIGFRSYTKPLGYPGDFQVMQYYYNNRFEGKTAFGKVIHKYYVGDYPLGKGVRTRKELIVNMLDREHRRVVDERGEQSTFKVVSLGCGPAAEVTEFIDRNSPWTGAVRWTLVDQEEEALSVAYRDVRRKMSASGPNGELNLLNLSFAQMLTDGLPLSDPESQDFIFCTGLFDYVREKRAQALLLGLYGLVSPGGLLAVGNAVAPNEYFWATEFLVDWTLLFRTRSEMKRLAVLLPSSAECDVVPDPSGAYYFLTVRKH